MSKFKICPAYKINNKTYHDTLLGEQIVKILQDVECSVKTAFDEHKRKCKIPLPTTFDIPGLQLANAQKHIYYHVAKTLQEADYDVKLKFLDISKNKQEVFMIVSWESPEVLQQEKDMDIFLKKITIQ